MGADVGAVVGAVVVQSWCSRVIDSPRRGMPEPPAGKAPTPRRESKLFPRGVPARGTRSQIRLAQASATSSEQGLKGERATSALSGQRSLGRGSNEKHRMFLQLARLGEQLLRRSHLRPKAPVPVACTASHLEEDKAVQAIVGQPK